jgi:hypothetical protein
MLSPLTTSQVDLANYHTTIHWADHLLGYNMPIFQFPVCHDISDVYSSASANDASIFGSWMMSHPHATSEGDSDLSTHPSYGGPVHSSYDNSESVPVPDISVTTSQSKEANHLKGIMKKHSKWRLVLSYLQLLIRVAICKGEIGNPHFITIATPKTKATLICCLFNESLIHANTNSMELEQGQKLIHSCNAHTHSFSVVSAGNGRILSENKILVMVHFLLVLITYLTSNRQAHGYLNLSTIQSV